jgi:hypothetical protein
MKIIYQDLDWSLPTVKRMAQKNAGLSSIFKTIRKQERTCYIGDIPMFTCVINTLAEMGITKNRSELSYSLRKIEEYRDMTKAEKNKLLDIFYNIIHATENNIKGATSKQKGGNRI